MIGLVPQELHLEAFDTVFEIFTIQEVYGEKKMILNL